MGTGWSRLSCDLCQQNRDLGFVGHVQLGGVARPGLLAGAEADWWLHSGDRANQRVSTLQGVLILRPDPARPFFYKAGVGVTRYRAEGTGEGEDDVLIAEMWGVQLGAGVVFDLVPGYSMTNSVEIVGAAFGDLQSRGESIAGGVSLTKVRIRMGVIRH